MRDAEIEDFLEDIVKLPLIERRWSFVCALESPGLFLKVAKGTPQTTLRAALTGREEHRIARNEANALELLARVPDTVTPRPIYHRGSVVVTELARDVRPLSPLIAGGRACEYSEALRSLAVWLRTVHVGHPGLVVDGLKLDNVLVRSDGSCFFVDPNEIMPGSAECDVARFVVSLVMAGFERGRLPSRRALPAVGIFLSAYGRDALRKDELLRQTQSWTARMQRELTLSARRRVPTLPHALARVAAWMYIVALRRRIATCLSSPYGASRE